jgi:tetratricopeptide (TPR) repeat protein
VDDAQQVVELAERAVTKAPRNYSYVNTLGAALFRADRFEESIERLNSAIRLSKNGGSWADWVFLAMAHQRLGNAEEARKWLAQVPRLSDDENSSDPPIQVSGIHRIELRILRREAEALINGEQEDAEAATTPEPAATE